MARAKLVAKLTSDETPLAGKTIEFYRSTDGVNYVLIGTATTDRNGIAVTYDTIGNGRFYYRAQFPGDSDYEKAVAEARIVYVDVSWCYNIAKMQMMMEATKALKGREADLTKAVNTIIMCKMIETLFLKLST